MVSYLVTGGAGFIGSHIVEELLKRGHEVRVLDNFLTGKRENLASFARRIELVEGDIRDSDVCGRAVEGMDYVLHQAALPSVPRSVWEVIQAASSKPFGFMPFYPGPGLGGHCIPIDPFYLTWKAREVDYSTKFIELAGEINTAMPYYVINKTLEALAEKGKSLKGSKILVLGIAYKKDIDDQRESPALKIISLLQKKGAKVEYNDPYVPESSGHREYPGMSLKSVPLTAKRLRQADAVIIATDHASYDFGWIVKNAKLVVDTRNAVKKPRGKVVKA